MRKCSKCKLKFTDAFFEKRKDCKSGFRKQCKGCRQKVKSEYYKKNIKELKEYRKKYYEKNKETYLIQCSEYAKNNRSKKNNQRALRRCLEKNSTPAWANLDKIKKVYEKAKWLEEVTGLKYHVDHIIPLSGKNVCGLHVWENLQILEASLNLSKGNRNGT